MTISIERISEIREREKEREIGDEMK